MTHPKFLECNLCGKQQPYERFVPAGCQHCQSQWLEARYDYDTFKREILRGLPNRPFNMWRYRDVLPVGDSSSLDLYPTGGTTLEQQLKQQYEQTLWLAESVYDGSQAQLKEEAKKLKEEAKVL